MKLEERMAAYKDIENRAKTSILELNALYAPSRNRIIGTLAIVWATCLVLALVGWSRWSSTAALLLAIASFFDGGRRLVRVQARRAVDEEDVIAKYKAEFRAWKDAR